MIAIIPARGGSKGLPGKNTMKLNGKPLIAYAIEAAKHAACIDRVIVSTDDMKIAEIAKEFGAEIPFLRPDYLATDCASAVDVYLHAVEFLMEASGKSIEKFFVLLPTAPFRTNEHISKAYEIFCNHKATTLISVVEAEIPPSWYLYKSEAGKILNCGFGMNKGIVNNRQMDQGYYIPNGAIYILDYKLLKEERTYYCDNTVPFVMDKSVSVDIDTIEDFRYAEFMMFQKHTK